MGLWARLSRDPVETYTHRGTSWYTSQLYIEPVILSLTRKHYNCKLVSFIEEGCTLNIQFHPSHTLGWIDLLLRGGGLLTWGPITYQGYIYIVLGSTSTQETNVFNNIAINRAVKAVTVAKIPSFPCSELHGSGLDVYICPVFTGSVNY